MEVITTTRIEIIQELIILLKTHAQEVLQIARAAQRDQEQPRQVAVAVHAPILHQVAVVVRALILRQVEVVLAEVLQVEAAEVAEDNLNKKI